MKIALPRRTWILFSFFFVLSFSGLAQNFHINRISFDNDFERIKIFDKPQELSDSPIGFLELKRVNFTSLSMESDIENYLLLFSNHQSFFRSSDQIDSSSVITDIVVERIGHVKKPAINDDIWGLVRYSLCFRTIKGDTIKETIGMRSNVLSCEAFRNQRDLFDLDFQDELDNVIDEELSNEGAYNKFIAASVALSILSELPNQTVPATEVFQDILKLEYQSIDKPSQGIGKVGRGVSVKINSMFISGTLIQGGYLITDARLFHSNQAYVFFSPSDSAIVKLVRSDLLTNLALGRLVEFEEFGSEKAFSEDKFESGKECYSFGTLGSLTYQNTYLNVIINKTFEYKGSVRMQLDGPSHIGFSGAPMYNHNHELVGVIIASDFDEKLNLVFSGFGKLDIEKALNIKL